MLGSLFVQTSIAVILAAIPFYVRYSLGAAEGEGSLLLGAIFVTAIPSIVLWERGRPPHLGRARRCCGA